jgi:hypothetical protein
VIWYMYSRFQEIHLLKNQRYDWVMIAKTNWNAVIFLERFLRQTVVATPIDSIELLLLSLTQSDAVLSTSWKSGALSFNSFSGCSNEKLPMFSLSVFRKQLNLKLSLSFLSRPCTLHYTHCGYALQFPPRNIVVASCISKLLLQFVCKYLYRASYQVMICPCLIPFAWL